MTLRHLSAYETEILRRAVGAVLTSPHITDGQFAKHVGMDRSTLAAQLLRWPHIDDAGPGSPGFQAIWGALDVLCHHDLVPRSEWYPAVGVPVDELSDLFGRWICAHRFSAPPADAGPGEPTV